MNKDQITDNLILRATNLMPLSLCRDAPMAWWITISNSCKNHYLDIDMLQHAAADAWLMDVIPEANNVANSPAATGCEK